MAYVSRQTPFWLRLLRCWWLIESPCCLFAKPRVTEWAWACAWCGRVILGKDLDYAERWGRDPKRTVARVLKSVERTIRAVANRRFNTEATRAAVADMVTARLREVCGPLHPPLDLDAQDVGGDRIAIRPQNLFTGLLMMGVPYEVARQYQGCLRAELPQGSYYFNDDGEFVFSPNEPIEIITLDFKQAVESR